MANSPRSERDPSSPFLESELHFSLEEIEDPQTRKSAYDFLSSLLPVNAMLRTDGRLIYQRSDHLWEGILLPIPEAIESRIGKPAQELFGEAQPPFIQLPKPQARQIQKTIRQRIGIFLKQKFNPEQARQDVIKDDEEQKNNLEKVRAQEVKEYFASFSGWFIGKCNSPEGKEALRIWQNKQASKKEHREAKETKTMCSAVTIPLGKSAVIRFSDKGMVRFVHEEITTGKGRLLVLPVTSVSTQWISRFNGRENTYQVIAPGMFVFPVEAEGCLLHRLPDEEHNP